jgi:hypothetical protein
LKFGIDKFLNFVLFLISGLEDQMLGCVVAEERPDLEEAKNSAVEIALKAKREQDAAAAVRAAAEAAEKKRLAIILANTVINNIIIMKNNYLQQIESDINNVNIKLSNLKKQESDVGNDYHNFLKTISTKLTETKNKIKQNTKIIDRQKNDYDKHLMTKKHKNIQNNIKNTYICKICNFNGKQKCDYAKHLITKKHKNMQNTIKNTYICKLCNFNGKQKCDYEKHLLSKKHINNINMNFINILLKQ